MICGGSRFCTPAESKYHPIERERVPGSSRVGRPQAVDWAPGEQRTGENFQPPFGSVDRKDNEMEVYH